MKNTYFLMLFTGLSLSLTAQNTTLAKINFEAAEEAYNNSNYELALEKLTKAEEFFGQINLPILYLRVINQDKLLAQKPSFTLLQELKSNCASFLSNYSNDSDAFEKIKEVYHIDEKWSSYKTEADFDNYLKEYKVKQKREEIMALGKEMENDFQKHKLSLNFTEDQTLELLLDLEKKEYIMQIRNLSNNGIWYKIYLNDVKEIRFSKPDYMYIKHTTKTSLYKEKESMWFYPQIERYKEETSRFLKLIDLLKTVE